MFDKSNVVKGPKMKLAGAHSECHILQDPHAMKPSASHHVNPAPAPSSGGTDMQAIMDRIDQMENNIHNEMQLGFRKVNEKLDKMNKRPKIYFRSRAKKSSQMEDFEFEDMQDEYELDEDLDFLTI